MFKNQTPRQIALFTSGCIAVVLSILLVILNQFGQVDLSLNGIIIYLLVSLLISYVITYFVIHQYIYRKVKLIYKIIRRSKISLDEGDYSSDHKIFEQVEEEVEKWVDDQRREIETLKSLADYRREYVGDISHELKTPIYNIQGYINTLLDGGLYDEDVNIRYLSRAATNLDRLQNIVQDLDMISRLESGGMVLDIQKFDIRELTTEVFDHLEMAAKAKEIKLVLKEGAQKSFYVSADREAIRQVLINLVHNSIKYGKVQGLTKVSFYDMDKYILVEVADNGIGIEEPHLKHLFDRFYRVEKSRSRAEGGTGLGLSIVKHIIEAHQQTITVRSTMNAGSTFGFTLSKA